MTIEPFSGKNKDGSIWGRGSADPKGSVAAMTIAAIEATADKATPPLVLLFTCDEEAGFSGAIDFVQNPMPPMRGAVIGEPTGLRLVTAHKGIYRSTVTATGVAAHASMPEKGSNAIYTMAKVVAGLKELAGSLATRPPHPTLGTASLNVGIIRGGVAFNSVPDKCEIDVDRRMLPGENVAGVASEIQKVIDASGCGDTVTLHKPSLASPGFQTPDGPWLDTIAATLQQVPGYAAPYATDGAILQNAGIDCVVIGPGEMSAAHTKDESAPVEQVDAAVATYLKIIQSFAQ